MNNEKVGSNRSKDKDLQGNGQPIRDVVAFEDHVGGLRYKDATWALNFEPYLRQWMDSEQLDYPDELILFFQQLPSGRSRELFGAWHSFDSDYRNQKACRKAP